MTPSRSSFLDIRGIRHHLRAWGDPGAPLLVLLHGWMDVSASFQFLVDALTHPWCVVAPDWRGFGLSGRNPDAYWFPDYVADLDALLEHLSPGAPVSLAGHSLGGNVACIYAGVRPQRVRKVATLEGFGIPRTEPAQAPARCAQWLDELQRPPETRRYPSFEALARRLHKHNHRLSTERALFVARHWARETGSGEVELLGHGAHKLVNPILYRIEESVACWRSISAPVLWMEGADSDIRAWINDTPQQWAARKASFAHLREVVIPGAGHMVHHDQPEAVAAALEEFLREA